MCRNVEKSPITVHAPITRGTERKICARACVLRGRISRSPAVEQSGRVLELSAFASDKIARDYSLIALSAKEFLQNAKGAAWQWVCYDKSILLFALPNMYYANWIVSGRLSGESVCRTFVDDARWFSCYLIYSFNCQSENTLVSFL